MNLIIKIYFALRLILVVAIVIVKIYILLELNTINLTPLHCIGFIYLAFAHQTDGVYCRNEQGAVWKCSLNWLPKVEGHGEFARIMDETIIWYKTRINNDNFQSEIFEIAQKMNDYSWFTEQKKMECLKDLQTIALSDKIFMEIEKRWMQKIAEIWNIDLELIQHLLI